MSGEGWEGFADYCNALAAQQRVGRPSLRRKWANLRALADRVLPDIPDELVTSLLGKAKSAADPEENDLKALVSWAVGHGIVKATELRTALEDDNRASPLYWLAGLSGKSFGENVAPQLSAYWLFRTLTRGRSNLGARTTISPGIRTNHPNQSAWNSRQAQRTRGFDFSKSATLGTPLRLDLTTTCCGASELRHRPWSSGRSPQLRLADSSTIRRSPTNMAAPK